MLSMHVPRKIRRDISRHQSQRRRITGRHPHADSAQKLSE